MYLFSALNEENGIHGLPTRIDLRTLMQEVHGRFLCVQNDDMGSKNVHVYHI